MILSCGHEATAPIERKQDRCLECTAEDERMRCSNVSCNKRLVIGPPIGEPGFCSDSCERIYYDLLGRA